MPLLLTLFVLAGCDAESTEFGSARLPVVYGDDNRIEALRSEAAVIREAAVTAVVALVPEVSLRAEGDRYYVEGATLAARDGLCAGEAFAEQTSAAFCTGVLVDDDLVLTAGHCLPRAACAPDIKLIFGYIDRGDDTGLQVRAADVFACRAVVAHRNDAFADVPSLDYALVQLDRPVQSPLAPRSTAELDGNALASNLTVIGATQGLPLKVHEHARLLAAPEASHGYFSIIADLFHGDSGAPVLDDRGQVLGVVAGGQPDYVYDDAQSCWRANRIARATDTEGERASNASAAVEALCQSRWPSERLCGIPPFCGDGHCSGTELVSECTTDCSPRTTPARSKAADATCSSVRIGGRSPIAGAAIWLSAVFAATRVRHRWRRQSRRG